MDSIGRHPFRARIDQNSLYKIGSSKKYNAFVSTLLFGPQAQIANVAGASASIFVPSAEVDGGGTFGVIQGSASLAAAPIAAVKGRGSVNLAASALFAGATTVKARGRVVALSAAALAVAGATKGRAKALGSASGTLVVIGSAFSVAQTGGSAVVTFGPLGGVKGSALTAGGLSVPWSISAVVRRLSSAPPASVEKDGWDVAVPLVANWSATSVVPTSWSKAPQPAPEWRKAV